ncbi:hypothetical protein K1719_004679 [Acacia pycnantha]|nr:hypothetical protein K1719_004679 [Acacia pycnantha]
MADDFSSSSKDIFPAKASKNCTFVGKMTVLVFAMASKSSTEIGILDIKVINETCPQPNIEPWEMPHGHYPKPRTYCRDERACNPVFDERLPPSPSEDCLDEDGSYLLHFLGIYESQPLSSLDGGVIDNAETDNDVSTYQNHKDSDVKHNAQETIVESRPCVYLWAPQDWLMHPSLYCKYMEKYLYMPLKVDCAPEPSYGEVNGVDPYLLEIVEQIEYYFSSDNLIHDVNFQKHMNYYGGWVSLPFIASLPEVRELTLNVKMIEEGLKTLSFMIEIKDGTKFIRHRHSWGRWKPYQVMN